MEFITSPPSLKRPCSRVGWGRTMMKRSSTPIPSSKNGTTCPVRRESSSGDVVGGHLSFSCRKLVQAENVIFKPIFVNSYGILWKNLRWNFQRWPRSAHITFRTTVVRCSPHPGPRSRPLEQASPPCSTIARAPRARSTYTTVARPIPPY